MADEPGADVLTVPGDDVEDAVGEQVRGHLGEAQGRQRRLLGGLEDQRVAGQQRWADLPDAHQQREVPGRYRADYAERVAADDAGVAGLILARGPSLEAAGGAGEEADVVDGERNLLAGGADRL